MLTRQAAVLFPNLTRWLTGLTTTRTVVWITVIMMVGKVTWAFNVDTQKPIIYKGPKGSYFGYSVAMLENNKGGWILVGAPRANDSSLPDVEEPGALFQCNWQYRSSCKTVLVDQTGNEKQIIPKNKNYTVHNKKDFQWLGGSLDVNYNGDQNVIVCAPRWKDGEYHIQGLIFMNGLCYESSNKLDFHQSSPWPVLDNVRMQVHSHGHLLYGMGNLGLSAHYSQDGTFLVLGAPGLNDWTGGYVHISGGFQSRPQIFEPPRQMHNNSYLGYSTTTAHLTADAVFTIVGGPRAGNTGKVIGYNKMFEVVFVKEGEQFGSYFGASVCSGDLNGDGLDDLLVGAPMYMDKYDEGRVYVYINKEFFNLVLLKPVLKGSNTPGARFGTTIVNLHDINNDHFHDIAIGAPYEAVTGVVYIYNGAKTGLHEKFSQRIVGSEIDKGLRAFGYAISRPWDIDGNYYSDFVVGAYGSDRAVLLRTRSVLDLQARLDITPSTVSYSQSSCAYRDTMLPCVRVTPCLKYTGINLPPATEVKMTLRLDTLERHRQERPRMFLVDPLSPHTQMEQITGIVELRQDMWSCVKTYTVFVRTSRDVITPLQIELDYDIPPNVPGISMGCDICPIRNIYSPTKEIATVVYDNACGHDEVCIADLQLQAEAIFDNPHSQDKLLISDSPVFHVEIKLLNLGETAYLTYVVLNYPDAIQYSRVERRRGNSVISCMPAGTPGFKPNLTATLECDLMSPVAGSGLEEVVFRLRFHAASLPFHTSELIVGVEARTASREAEGLRGDNYVNITVPLEVRSKVKMYSVSIPGQLQIPFSQYSSVDSTEISVTHQYTLHNLGPSPFPHGYLTVTLPKTPWMWLSNVQAMSRKSAVSVPLDCEVLADTDAVQSLQEKSASNDPKSQHPTFTDLVCEPGHCTTVHCYVGLIHRDQSLILSLNTTISRRIMQAMKIDRQLRVISTAILEEPDLPSFVSIAVDKKVNATTYLVYEMGPRPAFAWWVLGVSVVSGFLLLYIVTVILWKCGFFRRKHREELQKLLETTSTQEGDPLYPPSPSTPSPLPPPFLTTTDDDNDIMVLPPTNTFFPDSSQQTLLFRSSNDSVANNNLNHFSLPRNHHRRSGSGGYGHNCHRHGGGGGSYSGSVGGSLGRHRHHHWTPPPPPPLPAFNNQLYLEPLEHTV